MLKQDKRWKNEKGMALVIAILITTALISVGSFAMVMTNTELDISKNDRFGKEVFYVADGAPAIYANIIGQFFFGGLPDQDDYPGINIDSNLDDEIYNYDEDAKNDDSTDVAPDLTTDLGGKALRVDIDFRYACPDPGSSLLTHMGYEGTGIKKETRTYFDVESVGISGSSSRFFRSEVHVVYKY